MRHLLITLALAACGQPSPTSSDRTADTTKSPVATSSGRNGNATSGFDKAPQITLTFNGIMLVGAIQGRKTSTVLAFGQDRKTVLDVMEVDFPASTLSSNDECGAGPMEFAAYGSLKLNFLNGKLVGWLADKSDNVVTSDGISPGVTIGDLKRERSVKILDSTLDGEFEYVSRDGGTIGGFADGEGDDATVTSLHAGTNCFFR